MKVFCNLFVVIPAWFLLQEQERPTQMKAPYATASLITCQSSFYFSCLIMLLLRELVWTKWDAQCITYANFTK